MTNLTRRNFVKGAAVAGSAATMLSMAACGGSDSSTTDGGEKKKVLRFGQSNAKLGLDMQKSTNSGSSSVSDCVFEAPLRWTEDNELVPCLLTEIPTFEDDGVTLHCTLKEGIKCHDGSTLTANDVKFTFERMFKPETAAKSTYMYDLIKGAKDMLAGTATELEGLTVEDDTHFTFVLESPMVTFINNLGISYAQIYPQKACEEAGDQWGWGTNCVGTGKYKIVENDDTTEVKFEKFADYHDGEPALDEIDIIYYDDNNTKLMAFKNGDIDWCDVSADMLTQYSNDPDVKDCITLYNTLGVHFVNLNLQSDNLKDVKVREALSLAIDRQALIDNIEMSISKTDERIGRLYLQLGGREDLSSKVLDEMELTRKWVLAIVGDEWPLQNRRVLGPVIRMRLPFVNVLSVTQAQALKTLRTKGDKLTPEERERFIYLILCTVSGVAAGLQNTG